MIDSTFWFQTNAFSSMSTDAKIRANIYFGCRQNSAPTAKVEFFTGVAGRQHEARCLNGSS